MLSKSHHTILQSRFNLAFAQMLQTLRAVHWPGL